MRNRSGGRHHDDDVKPCSRRRTRSAIPCIAPCRMGWSTRRKIQPYGSFYSRVMATVSRPGTILPISAPKPTGEMQEKARRPDSFRNLGKATRPLVAAVQGNAVGVGTTMLLALRPRISCRYGKTNDTVRKIWRWFPRRLRVGCCPNVSGMCRASAMFALGEPLDAAAAFWPAAWPTPWCQPLESAQRPGRAAEALTKRPAGSLSHTKALMCENGQDYFTHESNRGRARYLPSGCRPAKRAKPSLRNQAA